MKFKTKKDNTHIRHYCYDYFHQCAGSGRAWPSWWHTAPGSCRDARRPPRRRCRGGRRAAARPAPGPGP